MPYQTQPRPNSELRVETKRAEMNLVHVKTCMYCVCYSPHGMETSGETKGLTLWLCVDYDNVRFWIILNMLTHFPLPKRPLYTITHTQQVYLVSLTWGRPGGNGSDHYINEWDRRRSRGWERRGPGQTKVRGESVQISAWYFYIQSCCLAIVSLTTMRWTGQRPHTLQS